LVVAKERHLDFRRVLDDVIVRDDEAVLADDEAAAFGVRLRLALAAPALLAPRLFIILTLSLRRLAEEPVEEVFGRVPAAEEIGHFIARVHLGANADDH